MEGERKMCKQKERENGGSLRKEGDEDKHDDEKKELWRRMDWI